MRGSTGICVDYSKYRMLYKKEQGIYKQFRLSLIFRLMLAFTSQIFISDMLMEYSNYFINNCCFNFIFSMILEQNVIHY